MQFILNIHTFDIKNKTDTYSIYEIMSEKEWSIGKTVREANDLL